MLTDSNSRFLNTDTECGYGMRSWPQNTDTECGYGIRSWPQNNTDTECGYEIRSWPQNTIRIRNADTKYGVGPKIRIPEKSFWYSHLEECSILSSCLQGDGYDNDITQSYLAE